MEYNKLHVDERLEKQKIAEIFAKRGTIPAGDQEKHNEFMNGLVNELVMNTRFISPVTITGEGDTREVSFQMIKSPQGEHFFPIFTSSEDLEKWEEVKGTQTIQLAFDDYAAMLNNNEMASGVAVNPFSDNFRVDKRIAAQWFEHKQMLVNGHTNHQITKDTKYELYAPSPYPFEVSDKLCETAGSIPEVKRVWLRGIKLEGRDGYLTVVELAEGDPQVIIPKLAEPLKGLLNGMLIHFVVYGPGFSEQAVENVLPIYAKND